MLRKFMLLLALVCIASLSAQAQSFGDKLELYGGYSYMRFETSPAVNMNGFDVAGQYKINNWLGAVADVGGEYGKVGGVSSSVYTYLVGPQVSWPSRLSPFAHLLFGGASFTGGGFASRGFSLALGAGIDTHLRGPLSWRIIQLDYLPTHLGGNSQSNDRVSTGIVLRF
jgi:Outer membrane protein beta-barrel domain